MTVENITPKINNNPSDELIQMIDSLVITYKQTTEERDRLVRAIINQGRAEGLEDMQIRGLIETSLKKHGLSDRSIRYALPDELKHTQMIRVPKQKVVQQEDRQVQEVETRPIPTYHEQVQEQEIPIPTPVPEPIPTVVQQETPQPQQTNKKHDIFIKMPNMSMFNAFSAIKQQFESYRSISGKLCTMYLVVDYA